MKRCPNLPHRCHDTARASDTGASKRCPEALRLPAAAATADGVRTIRPTCHFMHQWLDMLHSLQTCHCAACIGLCTVGLSCKRHFNSGGRSATWPGLPWWYTTVYCCASCVRVMRAHTCRQAGSTPGPTAVSMVRFIVLLTTHDVVQ